MTSTNAKTANGKSVGSISPTAEPIDRTARLSTNDTNLIEYVRLNAPYIVSALSCAASRAGEQQLWSEMNSYLGIANNVSTLTGFADSPIVAAGAARTMAAGSGASG